MIKQLLNNHDWLVFEHLLPYSPQYNPIERFWQWLKVKVYGVSAFATIEAAIDKLRRLIWHYHEGWSVTDIHFDFESYRHIL